MMPLRQVAAILAAACCLLAGCAARTPLLAPDARGVELVDTPFFPQEKYQCGPASLATVLAVAGVSVSPEELVPQVYLPTRNGSLTIEMQAAPRGHGVLSYPLAPRLDAIVAELEAGRPVLVLHNYGLPFWPRWHYAVVIGYDATRQRMLLRSGTTRRQEMSAASFMRAWDNADRWAMVLLRPGELPARPELQRYLEAATAFERAATPAAAERTYDAAAHLWPDEPVAWVGRGTARYRSGDWPAAAADYAHALKLSPSLPAARNNLAMALLKLGCATAARRELDRIDATALDAGLRAAIADTSEQVASQAGGKDNEVCSALY